MAYAGPNWRLDEGKKQVERIWSCVVWIEMPRLTSELEVETLQSERSTEVTPATPKDIQS